MMETNTQENKLKHSGIDWLGDIPVGWGLEKIGGLFLRKKEHSLDDEELLSVYRDYGVIVKSSREDNFNKPSEDLSNYILIKPGDLVVNKMKAWQGSLAISQNRGIVSPAYFSFEPKKLTKGKAYLRFFHYLLRSVVYVETYKRISNGIRPQQWDMDPYQFKILPILFPPLETQQRIADFLDEKTKIIDELVVKKKRLIELLREKRVTLITHTVTKGLNPNAKFKPSGIDWLGDIPEGWEVKRLKFCLGLVNKKVISTSDNKVALENIEGWTGRYIETDSNYEGGTEYREQDILFGKLRPYLAKVFLALENGEAVGDILVYRTGKGALPKFAFYFFLSDGFIDVVNSSTFGAKMPRAESSFIGNLIFVLPDISEQKQIADFLDTETAKIDKVVTLIESQIEKLKEYRSSLIYHAVTGKIRT